MEVLAGAERERGGAASRLWIGCVHVPAQLTHSRDTASPRSRCAPAGTSIADIEGRARVSHLNTELQRDRLQSRRASRAAAFMVTHVGRAATARAGGLAVALSQLPLDFLFLLFYYRYRYTLVRCIS